MCCAGVHTWGGGSGTKLNWLQLIMLGRLGQLRALGVRFVQKNKEDIFSQKKKMMIDFHFKNKNLFFEAVIFKIILY